MMRIILASASPRRKELFRHLFQDFEVIPATGDEVYTTANPSGLVLQLSAQKAAEIEQKLFGGLPASEDYLILGADTVVVLDGSILGKPRDASHAEQMLRSLSGKVHQVYTGVCVSLSWQGRRQCLQFAECTHVRFYPMTQAEIEAYIASGEPMDKAGGYGIQGIGARFVQEIKGDYQNVVGLPVAGLYQVLKKIKDFPLPFC